MARSVSLIFVSTCVVALVCTSGSRAAPVSAQPQPAYLMSGNIAPDSSLKPKIKSISRVVNQATQEITITGSNFGTYYPYNGDTPYLWTIDLKGNWRAGCYDSAPCGTWLNVTSWTDNQIVIAGFDGPAGGVPRKHDALIFIVYNPETLEGPAVQVVTVR